MDNNEEKISELQQSKQYAVKGWMEECLRQGITVIIREAYRSYEDQQKAYERFLRGEISAASYPGTSLHQKGLAIDIDVYEKSYGVTTKNRASTLLKAVSIAKDFNITQPLPKTDPFHIQIDEVLDEPKPFGGFPTSESYLSALWVALKRPQSILRLGAIKRAIARLAGR